MRKSVLIALVVFAVGCASEGTTEATQASTVITHIKVNGEFSQVLLVDADTNGGLTASRDNVAHTTSLDFSWASPDPMNSNIVILTQGAGTIPNSAFTISGTTAHLAVTPTFAVNRCVIDSSVGTTTCSAIGPISFNLTWTNNGFGSTREKTQREDIAGPVDTKFNGEFTSHTADVSGTWDTHSTTAMSGQLEKSVNTTITRDVTMTM